MCVCVCVCVCAEGRKEHIEKHVRKILDIRKRTRTCQENQAERILKRRRSELQPAEVGDSVTIAIRPVNRGHGDAKNVIIHWCHHTERQNDFYSVGVNQGFAVRSLFSQSV